MESCTKKENDCMDKLIIMEWKHVYIDNMIFVKQIS